MVLRFAAVLLAVSLLSAFAILATWPASHGTGSGMGLPWGIGISAALVLIASPVVDYWIVRPYIRARRATESSLRDNERRLTVAQRVAKTGSWELDLKTGLLSWSDEIYRIFEIDPSAFGASYEAFLDAIHPDDRAMVDAAYTNSLVDRSPYDIAHRLKMADGRIKWVHERCETEFDAEGTPRISRGTVQDITELRLAEDELRLAQFSLDQAGDAVFWIGEQGEIRYANRFAQLMLGYSASEFAGLHLWDIDPEVDPANWSSIWQRAEARDRYTFEAIHLTKSGEKVPVEVTTSAVSYDGGRIVCSFSRDISSRKANEERLRQAQKMEAVGQLTGGIAHEFNNLLMVISGNLELAKTSDSEQERQYSMDIARKGAARAAELTDQLLAFSHKQEFKLRGVDLNALTREVSSLIERALGETISVHMRLADGIWPILSDKAMLQSVLLNLSVNARDAMPDGGSITITTRNVSVDRGRPARQQTMTPGDYVMLEVTDTGTGMTPEVLEHAFDPFFTTKDVGQGTGLGLSVVHGFVEHSGGSIEIDSEVGRGTSVRILLPRAEDSAITTAGEEAPVEPRSESAATILVVEDDPDVRKVVVELLSMQGYTLFEAWDRRSALSALEKCGHIDVLFTGVALPGGVSGRDLARQAREKFPTIRIVYTSGYPDGAFDAQEPGVEPAFFISKPYDTAELSDLVRRAVKA